MTAHVRRFVPALALPCLLVLTTVSLTLAVADAPTSAAATTSAYVPVSPFRILDTRIGQGFPRRVNAGENFHLALPGVPAGASAVVLNVTIDGSADRGFVTVYPTGITRPTASSINVDGPHQTIANLVTVPIGTGGSIDVFSQMQTDLVADVQGYYAPAGSAQAGRFTPVTPTRLLDTREKTSVHPRPVAANESFSVNIAQLGALPADAVAAALNVTVTDSAGAGFWTVYPAGTTRPVASNVNVNGAGATIANQVLARLNNGQVSFYAQAGGNLVVDLVGWYTGPSAAASGTGLFVPVTPARVLDSREAPLGLEPAMNRTAEVPVEGRFGVPASGVGAVVLNATITQSTGPGYFTIWPARTYRPTASNINATYAGQTIANHVIAPISTAGFAFYTQSGAHLVADIAGWYTGSEVPAVLPPHVPLTGPSGPPAVSSYIFTRTNSAGPLRWNPCAAITYSVNLGGYTDGTAMLIREAVERVQAATGLTLLPAGDSTFVPTSAAPTPPASDSNIVITLSDEAHTDLVPGSVVGKTYISFSSVILRASVVIDMGDVAGRPDWSSTGAGPVLLHELGHAVGLGHVADPTQIMNSVTGASGPTTYAAGDLAGLWQLGAAAGCAA